MPNPPIPPALTADEWFVRHASRSHVVDGDEVGHARFGFIGMNKGAFCLVSAYSGSGATDDPRAMHGVAALCLHGHSFGFTHSDVALLRFMYEDHGGDQLLDIADRIAALLPPQDPTHD